MHLGDANLLDLGSHRDSATHKDQRRTLEGIDQPWRVTYVGSWAKSVWRWGTKGPSWLGWKLKQFADVFSYFFPLSH